MSPVRAVIRREYLQRVRSKWFLFSTLGAPVLLLLVTVGPVLMGVDGGGGGPGQIVIVDRTAVLFDGVASRLEESGYAVERAGDGLGEAELRRRIDEGDLDGYLVLDSGTLDEGSARYVGSSRPSALRRVALRQAVVEGSLEYRLEGDAAALLAGGALVFDILDAPEGEPSGGRAFIAVYAGTFVLYLTLLLYGVQVMRSVLEEKTNRIVEVVVSAMRPWHLMLGKILGVGAVGLTQLAVWLALGLTGVLFGLPAVVAARPDAAGLDNLSSLIPGVEFLGLFLVFFLGGYFIFSGLFAAVGAMCNTEQEAQQAQTPVVLLLVVPVVLLVGLMEEPNSTLAVTLSLVPFFSPTLMFARAAIGAAPAWQVGLSVALMAATVVGVAWVAGRIYKVGILMAGKRPTLPELWRWLREA